MPRADITAHIDANARGFHDALRRVRSDADQTGRATELSFANVTARLRGAYAGAAALAGPVAAGAAAIAAAAAGVARVAEAVAAVGDEAKRAGVNVEAFQELKFVAEQNRIGVDALTDGLKELNLRADEFIVTGAGPAAEAFQRLGFDAETLATKLEDPSALLVEIIGRVQDLDRAAQIRIFDEIFGGAGGEQFVQLITQGEEAIRGQIQAANDLGIVMDEELIEKAEELDRVFNTVARTVGVSLQRGIVLAGTALVGFIDSFREFENQQDRTLENRLTDLGAQRLEIENEILRVREEQRNLSENALSLGFGERGDIVTSQLEEDLRKLTTEEGRILGILSQRRDRQPVTAPEFIPPEDPGGGGGSGAGGTSGGVSRATIADTIDNYAKVEAALREEIKLLAMSERQQRLYNTAKEAGVEVGSAEYENLSRLVNQYYAQSEAIEANREAMDYLRSTGTEALTLLLSGAENAEDGLRRLAAQIAVAAAQAVVLGEGPLAGLLGHGGGRQSGGGGSGIFGTLLSGIFGGFFADGGHLGAGKWGIAGERGPEIIHGPADVTPIPGVPREQSVKVVIGISERNGNLRPFVESVVGDAAPQIVGTAVARSRQMVVPEIGRYQRDEAGGDYRG